MIIPIQLAQTIDRFGNHVLDHLFWSAADHPPRLDGEAGLQERRKLIWHIGSAYNFPAQDHARGEIFGRRIRRCLPGVLAGYQQASSLYLLRYCLLDGGRR